MRKALNIRPYDKHSNGFNHDVLTKLKGNTFLLISDTALIGAITCNGNAIKNVAVSSAYQLPFYPFRVDPAALVPYYGAWSFDIGYATIQSMEKQNLFCKLFGVVTGGATKQTNSGN